MPKTLKELLNNDSITAELREEINGAVNTLIKTKTLESENKFIGTSKELEEAKKKLSGFESKEILDKRETLLFNSLSNKSDKKQIKDALLLANVLDDDDDKTIIGKVQQVIEERPYLQRTVATAPEIVKTSKAQTQETNKQYRFMK